MRVTCPGRQTTAVIENEPSGSTCRVWLAARSGEPRRCAGVRMPGLGRCARNSSATRCAADAELSAPIGVGSGRVRLAGFASAIGSLVPRPAAELGREQPGLEISSIDTHPPEPLELLRAGRVELAILYRYDDAKDEPPGI